MPDQPPDETTHARHQRRRARRFARLGQILLNRDLHEDDLASEVGAEMVQAANRARSLALFGEHVAAGVPVDQAVVATVRTLTGARLRRTARGFLLGLESSVGAEVTAVGFGQVLFAMSEYPQAWAWFRAAPVDALARLVPVEAATCALKVATADALAVAEEIGHRGWSYDVPTLVDLAGRFLATGHQKLAEELTAEARTRDLSDVDEFHRGSLENLAQWTEPAPDHAPAQGLTLGILDYYQPDYGRSSRNVGDYIQTLAMLGNLVRFRDTRFSGPNGLGELMAELQERVKPSLHLRGGAVDVTVVPVSRDFSLGDQIPEQTWMLAFGWHMHSTFRLGFGLPYHPNINPVFLSFHLNRVGVLTHETIGYLRAHGPIGCRDWTTVDLLLSAGVDAFFTGCLTSTVDAVFPESSDVRKDDTDLVAAIDLQDWQVRQIKRPTEIVTHGGFEHREADLVSGIRASSALLDSYQRRYSRIVTSRLHSYLPATSLALDVRFRPAIEGDVRFDGLYGMKPQNEAFTTMRDGLRDLIASMFERILAGEEPAAVYAHWRKITADHVAIARERLATPITTEPPPFHLAEILRKVTADTHRYGPHDKVDGVVTDVAMSLDQNLTDILPVTVESMLSNASGPVRLWVTERGLDPAYQKWFSDRFPQLPVTFLGCDHVDYGEITRQLGPTSVATMDRLLLPEILTDLDRVTYVDIDTVVEGDICDLAATDLAGHPLAARPAFGSGAQQWRDAGDLLPADLASDLRRSMAARHAFDFTAFNAGVLVLDLARMRADRFTTNFVPLMAGRFGLHHQDILNAYAGHDHAPLPPRWNTLPLYERCGTEPGIVHFAGAGKPWGTELVPEGHRWHHYARQFASRGPQRGDG